MSHIVYILESKKLQRFYIGYTSNLDNRMDFHLHAESRKYTYRANDWQVYLTIACESKEQALKIEKQIKQMKSRVYIQNLKVYPAIILRFLETHKKDC